jgi:hypothetical protein
LFVHIGGPSSNQATTLESQMIHMVQELFGQTLRQVSGSSPLMLTDECRIERRVYPIIHSGTRKADSQPAFLQPRPDPTGVRKRSAGYSWRKASLGTALYETKATARATGDDPVGRQNARSPRAERRSDWGG